MTSNPSTRIARLSLSEQTVQKIQELIEQDGLNAGDRIPTVASLSERFGVSRSVIREAIAKLATSGYVRVQHGGGMFLASPGDVIQVRLAPFQIRNDPESLLKLLEIRHMIEVETAAMAATRRSDQHLLAVRAAMDAMRVSDDSVEMIRLDVQFHLAIARCTSNDILSQFVDSIVELLMVSIEESYHYPGSKERSIREHEQIFQAVADRDPVKASEAMRAHFSIIQDRLKKRVADMHTT